MTFVSSEQSLSRVISKDWILCISTTSYLLQPVIKPSSSSSTIYSRNPLVGLLSYPVSFAFDMYLEDHILQVFLSRYVAKWLSPYDCLRKYPFVSIFIRYLRIPFTEFPASFCQTTFLSTDDPSSFLRKLSRILLIIKRRILLIIKRVCVCVSVRL